MELSDQQFEHIVGLITECRVGIISAKNEMLTELERAKRDLRVEIRSAVAGQGVIGSQLTAIEEDLGQLQKGQRGGREEIAEIKQSLEGVVQLTKSTWDLTESLQKHIHENTSLEHVARQESHRAQ